MLVNKYSDQSSVTFQLSFTPQPFSQLEDKNIQLEGTRARVRMLEQLQKPGPASSPDVVPALDSATTSANDRTFTRSEITTASMKAMSPLPLNLQLDHSSSTESAHDQAESNRAHNQQQQHQQKKKPPSKIPLVKNNTSGGRLVWRNWS